MELIYIGKQLFLMFGLLELHLGHRLRGDGSASYDTGGGLSDGPEFHHPALPQLQGPRCPGKRGRPGRRPRGDRRPFPGGIAATPLHEAVDG